MLTSGGMHDTHDTKEDSATRFGEYPVPDNVFEQSPYYLIMYLLKLLKTRYALRPLLPFLVDSLPIAVSLHFTQVSETFSFASSVSTVIAMISTVKC